MGAIDLTDMRCDTILGLSSYFWLIDLSFHNHVVFERFLFPQGHYSIQSRVNRKILCHHHSECLFITIPCRLRALWLLYPRRIVFPQKFKLDSTSTAFQRKKSFYTQPWLERIVVKLLSIFYWVVYLFFIRLQPCIGFNLTWFILSRHLHSTHTHTAFTASNIYLLHRSSSTPHNVWYVFITLHCSFTLDQILVFPLGLLWLHLPLPTSALAPPPSHIATTQQYPATGLTFAPTHWPDDPFKSTQPYPLAATPPWLHFHSPAPPTNTTTPPAAAPVQRIKLQKWNVVAEWNYLNASADCTICHSALTGPCVNCQKSGSSDCTPSWGMCSHTFHTHCLQKWIQRTQTCPLCSQQWEWKTEQ